jgi:hypothetical protein
METNETRKWKYNKKNLKKKETKQREIFFFIIMKKNHT